MSGNGHGAHGHRDRPGEHRAVDAAQKAIASPLLEETSIQGARGVLINITGGSDLTLHEVNEAASTVAEAAEGDANIIVGAVVDEALGDEIRVTVIATGFDDARGAIQPLASAAGRSAGASSRHADRRPQGVPRWRSTVAVAPAARGRGARGRARGHGRRPRHPRVPPAAGRLTEGRSRSTGAAARPGSRRARRRSIHGELAGGAADARRRAGARGGRRAARVHDAPPGELRRGLGARMVRSGRATVAALAALDVDPPSVRYARQVHGVVCLDADAVAGGLVGTGDALFTRQRGRPLAIFTADCVPLIVADPSGSILGWLTRDGAARCRASRSGSSRRSSSGRARGRTGSRPRSGRPSAPAATRSTSPSWAACGRRSRRRGTAGAPRRAGSPRPLVAGPLDGQRRSAGGGRRASAGDPEPQPLHRLPAGPLLLVPEGGPGGAARDARRARVSASRRGSPWRLGGRTRYNTARA